MYICIYICVYIFTSMQGWGDKDTMSTKENVNGGHFSVNIHMYICIHTLTSACIYVHEYTIHVYIFIYIHVYYVYINTQTHIRIHMAGTREIHTNAHTHAHTLRWCERNVMSTEAYVSGSNNGGGGGFFPKVKRLVRKCIGARKRLFSGFVVFRPYTCGILEKQQLFPRNYFAHKTTYACLSLFMDCWNVQENSDSDLF